jgi:hypothetical protein
MLGSRDGQRSRVGARKGESSVGKWGQIGAPEKEEIGRKMGANRNAVKWRRPAGKWGQIEHRKSWRSAGKWGRRFFRERERGECRIARVGSISESFQMISIFFFFQRIDSYTTQVQISFSFF